MKVSVIIPVHNRQELLPRTLRSVARQTHRPLELILVDNLSTDRSPGVMQAFAAEQAAPGFEVRLLSCTQPGASAARNTGLEAATGEVVYFFDSDDEMDTDFLHLAAERLAAEPQLDGVCAATRMVFPDGRTIERRYTRRFTLEAQLLSAQFSTQTVVYRTALIRRLGGWNEALPLWNDWELGLRLMLAAPRLGWLDSRAHHRIHQHDRSITGGGYADTFDRLQIALGEATRLITRHPRYCPRWRVALLLRHAIVAGRLRREGNGALADRFLQGPLPRHSRLERLLLFNPLCLYTARGGRAAWRLALGISQCYHDKPYTP